MSYFSFAWWATVQWATVRWATVRWATVGTPLKGDAQGKTEEYVHGGGPRRGRV